MKEGFKNNFIQNVLSRLRLSINLLPCKVSSLGLRNFDFVALDSQPLKTSKQVDLYQQNKQNL